MSYGHRLRKWISNGKRGKNQIKLALFVTTYMGTSSLCFVTLRNYMSHPCCLFFHLIALNSKGGSCCFGD